MALSTIRRADALQIEIPSLDRLVQCRHITRNTIRLFHTWETGNGDAEVVYTLLADLLEGVTEQELNVMPYPEAIAVLRAIGKHTQEVIIALGKEEADWAEMATAGASG